MYRKVAAVELACFLGTISHFERIRIIEELRGSELDVSALQKRLEIAQSSVSRHLSILKAHRIVNERKEGRRVYYHLSVPELATWLIAGLDIINEKSMENVSLSKAFASAKKRWST
jgi:DNA-binding transcriptional ArsR family regulator